MCIFYSFSPPLPSILFIIIFLFFYAFNTVFDAIVVWHIPFNFVIWWFSWRINWCKNANEETAAWLFFLAEHAIAIASSAIFILLDIVALHILQLYVIYSIFIYVNKVSTCMPLLSSSLLTMKEWSKSHAASNIITYDVILLHVDLDFIAANFDSCDNWTFLFDL